MQLSREATMTDDKLRPLPEGLSLPNPKSNPLLEMTLARALERASEAQNDPALKESADRLREAAICQAGEELTKRLLN